MKVGPVSAEAAPDRDQTRMIHATIKKVTEDIETLGFNTALSQMMIFTNTFTSVSPRPLGAVRTLLQLLNPFSPHLTSELWEILDHHFADNAPPFTRRPGPHTTPPAWWMTRSSWPSK